MSIPIQERSVSENLSLVFGLFFSNLGRLLLLSLLFAIPILTPQILAILDPGAWTYDDADGVRWELGEAISTLLWLLLLPVLIGSVTGLVAGTYSGKKVSILGSLGLGIRRALPLLVYGVLYHLLLILVALPGILLIRETMGSPALILAALLAWIPAMTVLSMFFVGIPAVAVERVGPLAAFSRSLALTKGHRWRIFRFYFMTLLVTVVLYMMVSLLTGVLGSLFIGLAVADDLAGLILLALLLGLIGIVTLLLLSVIAPVVIYFQMCAVKENYQLTSIADFVDQIQERRSAVD